MRQVEGAARLWLWLWLLWGGDPGTCAGWRIYLSSWAVRVPAGAREAQRLARRHGLLYAGQVIEGNFYYHLRHRGIAPRSLARHRGWHVRLKKEHQISWFEQQTVKKRVRRGLSVVPNDPWFSKQWYMNRDVLPDLNVFTAWSQGYTGSGVVVSILDDGIEKDHPDLTANYDPMASYDFNDNDPDPQPRYNAWDENRHGTRCAGEVAAAANYVCGVGVAYRVKIGGVRMLDGTVTDIIEAQSLSFHSQHIDIYSASWGPEDDGKTVDGPGLLATAAFRQGVLSGRRGLGSLFVWASGNGGLRNDNCNCDGYTNSIYTLSVGSTTENGQVPWYNEACASILTTTYSSGAKGQKQIVTTDLRHTCTNKHTGTSASAPLAAGMIALALEANPALTWRDVYHLVVRASKPANLQTDDWAVNGVGRKVSHYYGYGLLDAGHLVDLAKKWTMIQPQKICSVKMVYKPLAIGQKLSVSKNISSICFGKDRHIHSLEHVQAQLTLTYSRRGDLVISLTSPRRTKSTLVALRPHDTSKEGYKSWSFMSTHFWDEDPQGVWTLLLENKGDAYNTGSLKGFVLKFYGTDEDMTARPAAASAMDECMHRSMDGKCMECSGTAYAFEHGCLSYCPPRYYSHIVSSRARQAIRTCAPCHPSCYTCQGGAENNCTACSNFSLYDQRNHVCLPHPSHLHHRKNRTFSVVKHPIVLAMLGLFCGGPILLCLFYGLQRLATFQKKKVGSRVEPGSNGLELMCLNAVGPGELLR